MKSIATELSRICAGPSEQPMRNDDETMNEQMRPMRSMWIRCESVQKTVDSADWLEPPAARGSASASAVSTCARKSVVTLRTSESIESATTNTERKMSAETGTGILFRLARYTK